SRHISADCELILQQLLHTTVGHKQQDIIRITVSKLETYASSRHSERRRGPPRPATIVLSAGDDACPMLSAERQHGYLLRIWNDRDAMRLRDQVGWNALIGCVHHFMEHIMGCDQSRLLLAPSLLVMIRVVAGAPRKARGQQHRADRHRSNQPTHNVPP